MNKLMADLGFFPLRFAGGWHKLKIAAVEFVGIKEIESLASNDKKSNYSLFYSRAAILSFLVFRGIQSRNCSVIHIYKVCQAKAL